jgi:hypothetical protein
LEQDRAVAAFRTHRARATNVYPQAWLRNSTIATAITIAIATECRMYVCGIFALTAATPYWMFGRLDT